MDEALAVRRHQRRAHLCSDPRQLLGRQGTPRQTGGERLALEKLGDRVGDAVLTSKVEDRQDVRVRERCDRPRLSLEARERVGIRCDSLGKHLDRDIAPELRIARAIDLSHSAHTEERKNLVGAEAGAGGECHWMAAPGILV